MGDILPADPSVWTSSTTGYIGQSSAGTVTVAGGSNLASGDAYLGFYSGASGLATISGAGSTWTNSNDLYVSYNGGGTLSIGGGGAVSSSSTYIGGVSGLVTVDGVGSSLTNTNALYAGYSGDGTLSITGGGSVSNYYGYIGFSNGSRGTVAVDGSGSTWTNNGTLWVGYSSGGTLSITNGGTVTCSDGHIGYNAGASGLVTVNGTGSTWTNGSSLYIGDYGTGNLSITNGGSVTNSSFYSVNFIGYNSGSSGTVTVNGAGSTWTTAGGHGNGLYVGYSGTGNLSITNGGSVVNINSSSYYYPSFIGYNSGSSGTVTVDGAASVWFNGSDLYVGGSGSGTMKITNGGSVFNTYGYIGSAGTVTVNGAGSIWGNANDLYVGGAYPQTGGAGTLNITNGGAVLVGGATYVSSDTSSTGTINFGASGGTLTTQSLYAPPAQLTGAGTVNTRGLVSDIDLVFNSTHGLTQTITLNGLSGQNVAVNLDMSNAANNGDLGAGYQGAGSLTIQDGIAVASANGYLGYLSGSTGTRNGLRRRLGLDHQQQPLRRLLGQRKPFDCQWRQRCRQLLLRQLHRLQQRLVGQRYGQRRRLDLD